MSTEPTYETVPTEELARYRRIEDAARHLLEQMQGKRSATQVLEAIAALRAALRSDESSS